MKLGDKIVLTSFGTLATDDKEYSIVDLENLLYSKNFTVVNFSFDEVEKRFILDYSNNEPDRVYSWNTQRVYIELSNFHSQLYDDGIIDPKLQKIFDLVEKVNYRKREKRICSQVLGTGDLPTDKEELKIYGDYLDKELSRTKANVTWERVASVSPLILGGLSYLLLRAAFGHDGLDFVSFLEILGGVTSGVLGVGALIIEGDVLKDLKKEVEEYKQFKSKKESVDKIKEGYDLVELAKSASVADLAEKEQEKAAKYQNVFLQEVDTVKKSIEKLPDGDKEIYASLLAKILQEYIDAITPIFENNDKQMSFGSASSVWEINSQMLPKVYRLGHMVDDVLKNMEEKNVSLDGYQELQKELEKLSGNDGYVDGYTDGYTDDLSLGSGGVAYAEPKKGL